MSYFKQHHRLFYQQLTEMHWRDGEPSFMS